MKTSAFAFLALLSAAGVLAVPVFAHNGGHGRALKPGGCQSQFAVANSYSAPVDVWAIGEDGDSGYLGTVAPGTERPFTHAYGPNRGGDSHCDRCGHVTQVRYVVPAGYQNAGQVICVDQFSIAPCYVRLTEFGGPGNCGHTRGIR